MRAMVIQSDFTGGEIDPKLYGRVSIPRYQSGLQTAKNVDIMVTGGATRRSGKKFVYNAGAGTTTRQLPFVIFRTDTTPASLKGYVVEFRSDNKIRFYLDGAIILSGGVPYEIDTPFLSADLSLIKYEQFNSGLYLVHPDFPPQILTRTSDTSWACTAMPFTFNAPQELFGSFFTERVNPKGVPLNAVCWSGTQFIAVGDPDGTDAYILYSPDGATWYERTNPKNVALHAVAWSGTQFVAVGNSDVVSDAYLLTSPDGATWTERANPKNISLRSVCWSGTQFVAVGDADGTDAYIITSPDGITWTERANPKNFGLNSVCWSGEQFVAVGDADGTDAYILTSPDGVAWAEQAPTVSKNFGLNSVCWSETQLVAVGDADGADAYVLTSPDGITWTEQANPKNFGLFSVAWSEDQFIACGDKDGTDAYIVTSADGITWIERKNPKNFGLNSVCWSGTQAVAVGSCYITSTLPGITWTERTNPKNIALDGVAWSGTQFCAVGYQTMVERGNPKNVALHSICWSGTQFVAVGYLDGTDAYLITSPDGVTWTERANPKNVWLTSVCWSGTQFVAVGDADGVDAYILTSPNGVTWTERVNPKNFILRSVCWSGTQFVAVGDGDGTDAYIVTSPDGTTWTERANPKNMYPQAVCWSGTQFVAVGTADGTDAYILTSSDGITWTERANPKNISLRSVCWSGTQFVAVGDGDGTDAYIVTSPDGTTWTERANPKNVALYSICWSGTQFVAVGNGEVLDTYIITSSDGIAWYEQTNPKNAGLTSVCWSGNLFIAVGLTDGTDAYIVTWAGAYLLTSPDGTTWTERANPKNISLRSVCWSGTQFVAVGDADGVDAYILTSPNGVTWTEQAPTVAKNIHLRSVCWSGTQFVAVGYADGTDAYIVTSPDGVTWTERGNPKSVVLYSVCWSGTQFVAVGTADGTDAYILTSSDGITWYEQTNPKNVELYSVCWSGTQFVAVGNSDAATDAYIVTSPDGVTWTERANPKNILLYAVCWSGTQFVAVGYLDGTDAYLITSPDGVTWTERGNPKAVVLYSVCWSGTQFVAVGAADGTDAYIVTSQLVFTGDLDSYLLTSTLPTTIEGITRSGSTATAPTTTPHGLKTGNIVTIAGADQTEYNGTFPVTVVDDYIFTYQVTGTPASPATGTITMGRVPWGTTGYPAAITFFEQRMLLARTKTHPQTIFGSETNNLMNFVLGVYDSSPFEFVPSAAAASINQLISTTQVIVLTNDKEITLSGGSGLPLTPSNVQIKAVGRYGSKDGIRPLPIGSELVFATRSGKRIRGMAYKLVEDSYNFPNVCIMSEHLLAYGIVEMFHASEPQSVVYILTLDGKIARVSYDRQQEVVAFSRYETDGLYKGICVVQEGLEDQIYVTVERIINGTTYTYVELFDETLNTDCAITGTDATGKTTWTGLSHLEGESVDVVADGLSVGPLTVTSGQIILAVAAKVVEIGLHYESELYDLKPEIPVGDGTAQGRTSVSVNEIIVRLNASRGCVINGETVPDSIAAFSGDKKISNLGWGGTSGQVQIKQTKPLPFTVLAIIKRLTVND